MALSKEHSTLITKDGYTRSPLIFERISKIGVLIMNKTNDLIQSFLVKMFMRHLVHGSYETEVFWTLVKMYPRRSHWYNTINLKLYYKLMVLLCTIRKWLEWSKTTNSIEQRMKINVQNTRFPGAKDSMINKDTEGKNSFHFLSVCFPPRLKE